MSWISFVFLLFGLSWAFLGIFRWYAVQKGMLDKPNSRTTHMAPTPRGGGVVFFLGWVILMGIFYYVGYFKEAILWYFSPVVVIGLLGFIEDRKGLSWKTRFFVQTIAACALLFLLSEGGELLQNRLPIFLPLPLCFALSVIGIVWVINLYNFMDGTDGLAATQALMVFGMGGAFLYHMGAVNLAIAAWGLCAMLGGFLTWNWPGAKIFMGDSGSYFLGFLIVVYALLTYKGLGMPLEIWLILTTVFWFDATVTLVRRILAKQKWSQPHRLHAYQRLIAAGWSHSQVLFAVIFINSLLSGLAVIAYRDPRLLHFSLGVAIALVGFLYILVEIYKPMFGNWNKIASPREEEMEFK